MVVLVWKGAGVTIDPRSRSLARSPPSALGLPREVADPAGFPCPPFSPERSCSHRVGVGVMRGPGNAEQDRLVVLLHAPVMVATRSAKHPRIGVEEAMVSPTALPKAGLRELD